MDIMMFMTDSRWKLEGEVTNSSGDTHEASGEAKVKVEKDNITISWGLNVKDRDFTIISKNYMIIPIPQGSHNTTWTGHFEKRGEFAGRITMIGKSIVITGDMENEEMSLMENIIDGEGDVLKYKGSLLSKDGIVESYSIRMEKA